MSNAFEGLAEEIFFEGLTNKKLLESFEYKKDKTFKDLRNAFQTGMRRGAGKFENEMREAGIELEKVLIKKDGK